jgi:hypothetical protein
MKRKDKTWEKVMELKLWKDKKGWKLVSKTHMHCM